ncbi:MAG: outer membrane protein assembly factor BamA [bacterium]
MTGGAAGGPRLFRMPLLVVLVFLMAFPVTGFAETLISGISIKGNFPIFERELKRVIPLRLGEEYRPERVEEVVERIEGVYQNEGYDRVRVDRTLEKTEDNLGVLVIDIHKGPRTRIAEVSFVDDRPGQGPDIEFLLGLKKGQVFKRKRFKERLKVLEERMVRAGFLRGDIRYLERIEDNGAYLDIFIYRGPKVQVRIRGNRYFSREEILAVVTFYENRFFDQLEAEESSERITDLYRDSGYIDVKVGFDIGDPDVQGDREVVFSIDEGRRQYLMDVVFVHGKHLKTKRLRRQFLSLRGFWLFRRRPFKQVTFEKDLEALEALYRSEGFPNVSITTKTEGKGRRLKKRIIVEEGVRMVAERLSFEGNKVFSERTLRGVLTVVEGSPLRPREFEDDRRRLSIFYGNSGYPYARVASEVKRDEETGTVDIRYRINEGTFARFGRIDIERNFKTRDKVIRLATPLRSGDPFSYQRILDAQERLSRLGLFNSLSVEPRGIDQRAEVVDCVIEVEETETGRVNLGVGFSSRLGYRGYMEIREDNLWGRAISGSFRADLTGLGGARHLVEEVGRSSKYTITFKDPLLLPRHRVEGEGSIYTATEDRREYHTRSRGLSLGLWRPFKRRLRIGLTYHIDLTRLEDITINPAEVPEEYHEHTISAIGPTLIYDSRDNFLDPSEGVYANLTTDFAGSWIGGDQDFYTIKAECRAFYPFTSRLVGALGIRGGYIGVYGQTTTVPIQERFFAGGGNTVRGFREDSLGPIDEETGLPLGGRVLWVYNLELRYPLYRSIKGVIFFDAGNVWTTREEFDIDDTRKGAGVGLRLITPLGPVRVDYARVIDKEPDEASSRFYLSIGHAF